MKKITAFFTIKRVILLMTLILLYSCAFLFVKVYAEKSIISEGEPSDVLLVGSESENSLPEAEAPVEYIVNKAAAGHYPMLGAAATRVSDTVEPATTSETTEATTAPTTSEAPSTTTEKKKVTTAPTTEPSVPKPSEPVADDEEIIEETEDTEEIDQEEIDQEEIDEEEEDDEELIEIDEPAGDDSYIHELSGEELQAFLDSLGIGSLEELNAGAGAAAPPSNPSDSLWSSNSYKNQVLTIYDTVQKRMRTENAFDLVCEITNREVGDSMDEETIKAQAVAVYTYCKYYEQKGEYAEIGTKADPSSKIIRCVEAVDGLAMFYDGKYIMAPFSASTGGYSASSKNVWGGDLPYLVSVKNDYDYLDSKNYGKVTTYTVDEVRSKIESKTDIRLSNNYSEWIRILSYSDTIYADQLSIDGHTTARINGKERTITGHYFRTYILNIRSTAFTVSYADGVFTFTTYGYGHGVGLSQIGADLYATYGGYTFDQILHHYFTGITIQ